MLGRTCCGRQLAIGFGLAAFLSAFPLSAQPTPTTSIRQAHQDIAQNGTSTHAAKSVTLVGVLATEPVVLGPEACVASLQDSTGGIQLFTQNTELLVGHFQRGDLVQVRGKLKQYKGMDELHVEEILLVGTGNLPRPTDVHAADLKTRRYIGQLVRVVGQLSIPHDFQNDQSCVLRDRSGEIPVFLNPKLFQNPRFLARLVQGGTVKVVGIAGQAKDRPPYDSGYRLSPRDADDFQFASLPPYREIVVLLSLMLLFGIFIDLWFRRRGAEQRTREMAVHSESLKRSEEALRVSEQKFSKAFRSSPDAIIISTLTDRFYIEVNDSFVRMTGYPREEVIGRSVSDLHIWVEPSQRDALTEQLRENGRVSNVETEFRRKSGEVGVGLMSAEMIDLGGTPCVLTVVRDVTARKEATKALEERTTYLNALIENSPLAIVVHDSQGRVQMCNPAFEQLFQYRQSEIAQAQLDDLIKIKTEEGPSEAEEITQRVLSGETVHITTRRRRKDGTMVDVELYGVPLLVQGAPFAAYGLYQDITTRVALEDQLRQAQKMEAVGRLAGGVAHDFNNILMVIKGHADLLGQHERTDSRRRHLEEIQKAANRAATLTHQLLAYSRKQVIEPKVIDLNTVVADMGTMLSRLLGEDVHFMIALTPSLGRVKADRGQVEQVLLNLATNARDAMPKGGKLTLETANVELGNDYALQHPEVQPGPYVMLAVSDTGHGMDAETMSHIFEPFFTTKEVGKGTGLGLATVFGIVKQNNGHISVYSNPGQGATFKVYLPRVKDLVEEPQAEAEQSPSGSLKGSETILLVEDEEAVRGLVRASLEKSGYRVLEARDGVEALRISEDHQGPIHLMVTDVVMPKMSGRELARRLGSRHPQVKVLYMSGYAETAVVHHGVLEPGTTFLQKPFRPADLARKIHELLDRHPQQIPLRNPVGS